MIRMVLTATFLVCASVAPQTTIAQDSANVDQVTHRVNIAGRQRMLTQRITKAACLMARDVGFTTSFDQMTQAYDLFLQSDQGLRNGDSDLGLEAESNDTVIGALGAIDSHWAAYKAIIETGIDNATIANAELDELDSASLRVLKFMNIAVYKMARAYASETASVSLNLAITVDIAGRQRMLTQKAVKEACLMQAVEDPSEQAARLADTVELFDTSLSALQDGFEDIGVIAPPTPEIARKLREVEELWNPVKSLLERAVNGEVLSDRDLSVLARDSEPLLQRMNEAVALYTTQSSSS
ncbi:type IV pili methyl-accepting chemotaxis transducer N-terminal domain-containing protein [Ruegeria sp. Ofav3-42]|uniref:type IV pili methyl-accepting chemotaxis transducer N-terminal domain-containing protein n=1 Tax=Ruegeria sp. Ofav3-42 TaxID=2917759 RepID=UPI001EF54F48|nr:type IV pili methyl-accepting chemotaxis transducer N-terminal domain-containing protein [Ruegeria sp. Ofav3-42]MCG7522461.1 type IV pili methyl-accepting chemotaxis transducer N-terminal domain-containing protein [Ruegeria sp. Ofav3-42]